MVCEVDQPGMVKAGGVDLGGDPIVKACVATDGSCLLLVRDMTSRKNETRPCPREQKISNEVESESKMASVHLLADRTDGQDRTSAETSAALDLEERCLTMQVYKLENSIEFLRSIEFDRKFKDLSKLVLAVTSFQSQMHLVIFDSEYPWMITSKIIKITTTSEVCQVRPVIRPQEVADSEMKPGGGGTQSGPVLDYIYHIFEKYATGPPLTRVSRDLFLRLVLKAPPATSSTRSLSDKCLWHVNTSIDNLIRDKGKDFQHLRIHPSVQDYIEGPWNINEASRLAVHKIQMGAWMRQLVCLVPIQIARAENNALKPLVDGLQMSPDVDYTNVTSLAKVIRFGLYEAVFEGWTGPIKVISSMGKQSSGKSYLLNHLSGSLLDVAGGRCTDGVWMSLRQKDDCLYVLIDFEGLGSFERSEQEDMLLSVLNAAISNLTIFNKRDFYFDKETEAIFERFQNGVALVKPDPKLFQGSFYIAIKDVDKSDVEDLKEEFRRKIHQICSKPGSKSQRNFLTSMYGGSVYITAMPTFNRREFHESIEDIANMVEDDIDASYTTGRSFLSDLKIIIAQISTKDWSPIDSKRLALRIDLLRNHLKSAVGVGCFFSDGILQPLNKFDDHVDISDLPLMVDDSNFPVCDKEVELNDFQDKKPTVRILLSLMEKFKSTIPRKGEKDEEWHSFFEKFIKAVVQRRSKRVLSWIKLNTKNFPKDGDIAKLRMEAVAMLNDIQQNLLLCSCTCERCFLRCVREKGHPSSHSCQGDHRCVAMCTFCNDEDCTTGADPCRDVAGHDGYHDCLEKNHTCGKRCKHADISSSCNENCSQKPLHAGDHQCNSRQHTCNQVCSLPSCKNHCIFPVDSGDHERHECHEKFCPHRCTMKGCNRTCATVNHFHGSAPDTRITNHFCGSEHPCSAKCEHKGNCDVLTEVSKKTQTQTFVGRRGTFDYELVSEQNGITKDCCIVIPPHKDSHEGLHCHTSNPDVVHFCEARCPSCRYFCHRPRGHGGLHNTTHGNMRAVNFAAESEEIDVLDRKYVWGESGVAEMCQMYCKSQGRGHIHLINCPANTSAGVSCRKIFAGAQHERRRYGPDFEVPKDEMTHATFWEYNRFEDPCSAEDGRQFTLCNHRCKSDEHTPENGIDAISAVQSISYCTESLLHQPIPKDDPIKSRIGYITDDGHHFSCDHSALAVNVIFIIDRSLSMGSNDIIPTLKKFLPTHENRLGCVYEAILRFIRTRRSTVLDDVVSVILFNTSADTVITLQQMEDSLVDELLKHGASGNTDYSSGLKTSETILSLAVKDPHISKKSPVIVFLSDGENLNGTDPLSHIGHIQALDPRVRVHTIMFGRDESKTILEDMAKAGNGTFSTTLDDVQLSRRFEGLARSLRPQVASLI